ncbi:hypothetical protein L226DRAFT_554441 [Lentinus tigrinus ALCF2SS1-7]|uniref:MYND-type domain-containing protein n=1 Tax=Lentinus tigrinus ALCF2SS1-6 TaxID=1328759 RepID=A0A5C2RZB5_9APHY|nr:hypothetical protein L227DRAFT_595201 [Lentinus tigrinus ALCF2SS1-6]RPD71446.1 hypothetical protein L226DRAFT_554441 [Lentinus tigrinus ALCF2SS1-7]
MSGTRRGPGAALAGESYIIPDTLFASINDGSTWNSAISRLSDVLKLPDITTRHGLKKVHARFPEIYKKLNAAYNAGKRERNEKIMGAVVGMMVKMCSDAILRDKLFEKGMLKKITPLLDLDSTRHLALNALVMITHHGGEQARQEIAHQLNKTLVKLVQDFPDDPKVAELAIVTMDHATEAVIGSEHPPPLALVKEIDVQSVLAATVTALRKPTVSHAMVTHALNLLVCAPQNCPTQCKAVRGLTSLIAAFLRSNNVSIRATALAGILRLPISECEPDTMHFDPQRLMVAASTRPPAHLREILLDYGSERSDINVMVEAMSVYTEAIMRAMRDRDMYALGKKLEDLTQRAEYVIAEGGWQDAGGRVFAPDQLGDVPFTRWTDALPLCVKALRAKGSKEDLDGADILEMKFLILRRRLPEARTVGFAAIKRNPRLAYAYYVISMGADVEEGLRAVKKGLKCPKITPFVRNQMLWRATSHAAQRGLTILQEARDGNMEARAEGTAFLMSAWEDTKTFISEAPPDTRHMLDVVGWYVLLTVLIRGPELSEDLHELDPARRKIQTSLDFMKFIGYSIKRTQLSLARDLLLSLYTPGAKEWGALIKRFDDLDRRQGNGGASRASSSVVDDDLSEWLGNVSIDHTNHHADHDHHACGSNTPRAEASASVETSSYELYRCSWCGNPSAVLRRCGGCGKTRYCDGGCQKSHWAEHKGECKPRNR